MAFEGLGNYRYDISFDPEQSFEDSYLEYESSKERFSKGGYPKEGQRKFILDSAPMSLSSRLGVPPMPGTNSGSGWAVPIKMEESDHAAARGEMSGDEDSDSEHKKGKRSDTVQKKNRQAQRRFRERQKARVTELEDKVSELVENMGCLSREKEAVEERLSLLTKILHMKEQQVQSLSRDRQRVPGKFDDNLGVVGDLVLTVRGSEMLTLTSEQVQTMSYDDLVGIWKEYMTQMKLCLSEIDDAPCSTSAEVDTATERVQALVNEVTVLTMRLGICNPTVTKAFVSNNLEYESGEPSTELWLRVTRSLEMSPEQRAQIIALRKQFNAKLEILLQQRVEVQTVLQASLPCTTSSRQNALKFIKSEESLEALRKNLREEHLLKLDWISTFFKHIWSPIQVARCIILSFPYTPDTLAIATWVAAEEGDPAAASQFIADFQGQVASAASSSTAVLSTGPQTLNPLPIPAGGGAEPMQMSSRTGQGGLLFSGMPFGGPSMNPGPLPVIHWSCDPQEDTPGPIQGTGQEPASGLAQQGSGLGSGLGSGSGSGLGPAGFMLTGSGGMGGNNGPWETPEAFDASLGPGFGRG